MPPKKKPLPLHVSLQRIEEERNNVQKRTQRRIEELFSNERRLEHHDTQYNLELLETDRHVKYWHFCLNVFCFCLLLLVVNLLFLQWLYITISVNQL
jgi:hypothetical protein